MSVPLAIEATLTINGETYMGCSDRCATLSSARILKMAWLVTLAAAGLALTASAMAMGKRPGKCLPAAYGDGGLGAFQHRGSADASSLEGLRGAGAHAAAIRVSRGDER